MTARIDHAGLMDRVYRHQRHFYDATRKFYLVGRDPMLAGLNVPQGGSALEIGCGTGRNLVKAGRLYPQASLYGIDISREMLATAGKAVVAAGIQHRSRLGLCRCSRLRCEARLRKGQVRPHFHLLCRVDDPVLASRDRERR